MVLFLKVVEHDPWQYLTSEDVATRVWGFPVGGRRTHAELGADTTLPCTHVSVQVCCVIADVPFKVRFY
jgi:hypothetical protein